MVFSAKQILHDQGLAEDATHDAFLRIINHLDKISDVNCHRTRSFVLLIVRNIALDYYRKRKRLAESSFDDLDFIFEDTDLNPAELLEEGESSEALKKLASQLRPIYAEVLTLSYSFNYSDAEIAELLAISHDTVRTRLHRARKQLQKYYGIKAGDM